MFRKKPPEDGDAPAEEGPVLPLKERKPGGFRPELAQEQRADRQERRGQTMAADAKTLVIGREINLKGEITDCDSVMVHGSAEASLTACRSFHISESGVLTGSAEVQDAEVLGRFEGTLKVRGKLTIRASGRVKGRISYASIEVEPGGRIDGEIDSVEPEVVRNRAAS